MNRKRQAIWDKSGGKCWYCGCDLPEKGWHADHFKAIIRVAPGVSVFPEHDTEENLVPSCASCNRQKSSMPLESFRKIVEGFIKSLNRDSTQYKIAKRYGLVQETDVKVTFWFEENGY
ncbi:HNH endonuclease [Oceanobacillus oncorhynchi]|uniref:HNH endonuclease n=1 Tax=Oceanobacillus oncorhynchi TaxID=545501 RepID=UPI001867D549|nr:HNH endonuclease signature motif containing protein [Oceanobacillus oncorhynchi]